MDLRIGNGQPNRGVQHPGGEIENGPPIDLHWLSNYLPSPDSLRPVAVGALGMTAFVGINYPSYRSGAAQIGVLIVWALIRGPLGQALVHQPANEMGGAPPTDLHRWAANYLPNLNRDHVGAVAFAAMLYVAYISRSSYGMLPVAAVIFVGYAMIRGRLEQSYEAHLREPLEQAISSFFHKLNRPEYFNKGGLNDQFQSKKPTDTQIRDINSCINAALDGLTTDGIDIQGTKLNLTRGRDMINFESFDQDADVEWCAVSQGEGNFNLVQIETANLLIQKGYGHLISKKPLEISDFIRGKDLLDLLQKQKKQG